MSVWDDVVGQSEVVATLRAAVTDPAAMTNAWLVTGPPGSGRSTAARAFAAALQCDTGGCGSCQACRTALAGTHGDVTVVATEKVTISIDEVRELVGLAQRSPSQGRWRVIIVEDADRMTERTSNVLLKSLEEPPARTVWVLCAPSPQDVIVTIRSRCRAVALRIPPVADVAGLLVERDGVAEDLALSVARAAQCHIGIARRLARSPQAREQRQRVLAIATEIRGVGDAVLAAADLVEVATAQAAAVTDDRNAAELAELLRTIGAESVRAMPPTLRAQVRQLEEDQKRRATRAQRDVLDRAMVDLLSLYRDVLVVQLGAQVELVNDAQRDTVDLLARSGTPEQTVRRMDAIGVARERLRRNVTPVLAVEAMAIALRPQG